MLRLYENRTATQVNNDTEVVDYNVRTSFLMC